MKKMRLDVEEARKNPIKDSRMRWLILVLAC